MPKSKNKLYFLLLFILVSEFSFSQSQINKFMHFDESNGLVQAVVSATQDKQGFLWFGTEGNNGVFRYDGVEFIQFKHNPNDENSIISGSIYSIICDSKGDLWFASEGGGVSRLDPKSFNFKNYINIPNDDNSLGGNLIYSLMEDSRGNIWISNEKSLDRYSIENDTFTHFYPESSLLTRSISYHMLESRDGIIWIGTHGRGLNSYDYNTGLFESYMHNPEDFNSIADDTCGGIVEDKNGNIWIGGRGGLNKLNRKTGDITRYTHDPNDDNTLAENFVWDIVIDSEETLWLGGFGGGLSSFDIENESITRFENNPLLTNSMSSNLIFFVFIDNSNVLWIGTVNGGLNKYNFSSKQFEHYGYIPNDDNSFTTSSIFTIYQTGDEKIWVGYQGHNSGLTMWDRKKSVVTHYKSEPNSFKPGEILSIFEDSKNRLYLGQNQLSIFNREDQTTKVIFPKEEDNDFFNGKTVRKIVEDHHENLWLATEVGLIKVLPNRKDYKLYFEDIGIRTLLIDTDGYLWIGTGAEGVKKYDTLTDKYTEFKHQNDRNETISSGEILAIYQDRDERMWFGSVGGGLNLLNSDYKTFTHFSTIDGLSSNTIFSIEQDRNGCLWMGSSWGLIKLDSKSGLVRNFTEQDGLQGNEFSIRSNGSLESLSGELIFVGKNGMTVFNPLNIEINKEEPPVVFTSIKLFNEEYEMDVSPSYVDHLEFTWKDNMITIDFAALDYNNPSHNMYKYMMKGFDKDWIYAGNKSSATYTNLDGGKYQFIVKASNNHDIWTEHGIVLPVKITHPWWKSWWAILSFIVVIISVVLLQIHFKISSIEKKKIILETEVKERTKELNNSLFELKEAQEQLIESGKMAALGSLVAGVAHEINTPLGIGITGISHLTDTTLELSNKVDNNELSRSFLDSYINTALSGSEIILNNMNKAAQLVKSFKSVAVDQTSENIREFEVVSYIKKILISLNPKLRKTKHNIDINYSKDFTIYSSPGALSQVISNLIMNSLLHGFEDIENGHIDIDVKHEGNNVKLDYRDNGIGISQDIIPKIFDPFFTTKRNQGGSGLGMHILYNLVTQTLKGKVQCIDTSMKGCHFIITFPTNIKKTKP